MRSKNSLFISLAVLVFVFSASLLLAFRNELTRTVAAGLDRLKISVGLYEQPQKADKEGISENEKRYQDSLIGEMVSELVGLERSRRELSASVIDLNDEIVALELEIQELEYVILEEKFEAATKEPEKEGRAATDDEKPEEDLSGNDSGPADEMPESRPDADASERRHTDYVDLY